MKNIASEILQFVVQDFDALREPMKDVDADQESKSFGSRGKKGNPEVCLDGFVGAFGPERMRKSHATGKAGDASDNQHGPYEKWNAGCMNGPVDGGYLNEAHIRVPLRCG